MTAMKSDLIRTGVFLSVGMALSTVIAQVLWPTDLAIRVNFIAGFVLAAWLLVAAARR